MAKTDKSFQTNALGNIAIVLFLLGTVAALLGGGPHALVQGMILMSFGGIGAGIVAGVVYMVSRRSQKAGNIALAVALAIWWFLIYRFAASDRAAQHLAREIQTLQANARQQRAAGNPFGPQEAASHVNSVAQALETASRQMTGDDAKVAKTTAAFARQMQKEAEGYNAALLKLQKAPGANPATATSVEQIDEALKIVDKLGAENEKLIRFFTDAPDTLQKLLNAEGVSSTMTTDVVNGFLSKHRKIIKLRESDRDLVAAMGDTLRPLREHWGHWTYNRLLGMAYFDDTVPKPVVEGYVKAGMRVTEISQRQVELQQQAFQ
jgi:hypothetical protein